MQEDIAEETAEEQVEEKPAEAEEAKEGEEIPCWKANPGCGTGECTSVCPAYVNRTVCWQFDWKTATEGMDDMSKAELAKLVQNCPTCPVYKNHSKEMRKIMALVIKK
ncbi:MAG: hypothetical protein GTN76_00745 [Candidatus Aenigmarchaeota archaeon]|nr:hypothetical protein [Candidatus Aenigmarchaeota archaeon]